MDRSSRAPPSAPLPSSSHPKTDDYFGDAVVPTYATKRASTSSTVSTYPSSTHSSQSQNQQSGSKSSPSSGWVKTEPTRNVHTTCGRHTDQLLFGGPSIRDLAKAVWKG